MSAQSMDSENNESMCSKRLSSKGRRTAGPSNCVCAHQPDSKQIREGKDSCRLAMTVGMDRIRLNAQIGLHESVDDVDGFLHARRNEVSKVCDVVVGNVALSHRAYLAVMKG
jgi:hypothetical protein